MHGAIIELNPGFNINQVREMPPAEAPITLYNMIQLTNQIINDEVPSLQDVFVGEAPYAQASGKAIGNLQSATFNQLSDNVRSMNEFRRRKKQIMLNFIQEHARIPLEAHMWRKGVDLPEIFPEDARHIGFELSLPDTTSIPNTTAGRMQILGFLAQIGIMIKPDKVFEFLNLDRSHGLEQNDFVIMPPTAPGQSGEGKEESTPSMPVGVSKAA